MTKEIRRRLNNLGRLMSGCFMDVIKDMTGQANKEKESRTFD